MPGSAVARTPGCSVICGGGVPRGCDARGSAVGAGAVLDAGAALDAGADDRTATF